MPLTVHTFHKSAVNHEENRCDLEQRNWTVISTSKGNCDPAVAWADEKRMRAQAIRNVVPYLPKGHMDAMSWERVYHGSKQTYLVDDVEQSGGGGCHLLHTYVVDENLACSSCAEEHLGLLVV